MAYSLISSGGGAGTPVIEGGRVMAVHPSAVATRLPAD